MSKGLIFAAIALFLCYWMVTIFFNLPENPIKIKYARQERIFQGAFFQRWAFFAPPPKANDKLYYLFRSRKDTTRVAIFEALDSITANKRSAIPFNTNEEIIDYIISGSISEITNFLSEYDNELRVKYKNMEESKLVDQSIRDAWKLRANIYSIETLLNYGELVANKNNIDLNENEMKFLIANKEITRFKDIDKDVKDINPVEQKLFETPYILRYNQ